MVVLLRQPLIQIPLFSHISPLKPRGAKAPRIFYEKVIFKYPAVRRDEHCSSAILVRIHSVAVGRSLGAAETNSADSAAVSHRSAVLLMCGEKKHRRGLALPFCIAPKETCRGDLRSPAQIGVEEDPVFRRIRMDFIFAVVRTLGAAVTISSDSAAASHRPAVLFRCGVSSAGDRRSPLQHVFVRSIK